MMLNKPITLHDMESVVSHFALFVDAFPTNVVVDNTLLISIFDRLCDCVTHLPRGMFPAGNVRA